MNDLQNSVTITLLSKTYKVKCPSERMSELREAAEQLDKKMREIGQNGKVNNVERVAVIAALNIIHELLTHKRQNNQYIDAMSKRIQDMQSKIDAMLVEE